MRRALLTHATGEHYRFLEISKPLMQAYADRHGYELIVGNGDARGRPSSWGKIVLLQRILSKYEVALWVDCDIMIVDQSIDIASDVAKTSHQAVVKHHVPMHGEIPNFGLWYNTRDNLTFLKNVWNQRRFVHHGWWEQAAALRLMGYRLARRKGGMPTSRLETPTEYYQRTTFLDARWNNHPFSISLNPSFWHVTTGTFTDRLLRMMAIKHAVEQQL